MHIKKNSPDRTCQVCLEPNPWRSVHPLHSPRGWGATWAIPIMQAQRDKCFMSSSRGLGRSRPWWHCQKSYSWVAYFHGFCKILTDNILYENKDASSFTNTCISRHLVAWHNQRNWETPWNQDRPGHMLMKIIFISQSEPLLKQNVKGIK